MYTECQQTLSILQPSATEGARSSSCPGKLKNNLKMEFCPLFRQHRNQSICLVKSLVNQWRPVFRHIQIPYQLWYQIAGESLIDDDIMHTLQVRSGCAPSFFS